MTADPFGTARLRESVLAGWQSSPTRFREDANAEEDLYLGGYRDRLLVELAQNASDAALASGVPGTLRLSVVDGELRAANTGTALDGAGVAALASLRASAKTGQPGVGRFGVGFAATLAVSDAPRIVSTSGGVEFSAARTAQVIATAPELAARAAERGGRVPVLRLPWPVGADEPPPPEGFDTEVRLGLRGGVDADALFAGFAGQVEDLLLSLAGLARIELGDATWYRTESQEGAHVELHGPAGSVRWLVCRAAGELTEEVTAGLGVEDRGRPHWAVCWAVRIAPDGVPLPLAADVLHAPTPTDERMSLPARLIATVPIDPSRRRLMPGQAAMAVLAEAAGRYPDLVATIAPEHRTALVPAPALPLSEVDSWLRDRVVDQLRQAAWLPAAGGAADLAPARARVLDLPGEELAELLSEVVAGIVDARLAGPAHTRALAALDVARMRVAEMVDALTGIDRAPSWWRRLYQALAPHAEVDASVREALGGLPVPLVDGRTRPGPRAVLLADAEENLLGLLAHVDTAVLDIVHPEAVHPLLERLGARRAGPIDLLDSPSLREAVERSVDDAESGVEVSTLVEVVLRLVEQTAIRPGERPWLRALALPDTAGDWRRADELALPDSALLALVDDDSPLGELAEQVAKDWPRAVLTAVGVLDSFSVIDEEHPVGPDHDLPDEGQWWDSLPEPPAHLLAVRDLDLVADHAWPQALRLLAGDAQTWHALRQRGGHTAWWIGRNALIGGARPRAWRLPSAVSLAGLYDPVPPTGLRDAVLEVIGVRGTLAVAGHDDAEDLLARLADPAAAVEPGAALRAHAVLAAAVRDETVDPRDVEPPTRVRTLTGAALPAQDCLVLDLPWLLAVCPPARLVSAGADTDLAGPLAELLDLPLAGEEIDTRVASAGERLAWAELGAVVAAAELVGLSLPAEGPVVHDTLTVRVDATDHVVPWWVDQTGVVHCEDSTGALARALAWQCDRWPDRHRFAVLIGDPDATSLLA